ncbi:hypothetical protein CB0940_06845 [Cercospora beticola]|uniref:Cyclase n=1 Tax=Cercospora beticola TaxID=122368 RepID=A0A2G5H977_CERBT|nr:hypothetical protein CB0940_06845 [Cercospora beticola]PIA89086.1 hypothetical protein CB0940_06845 [Cercospora beticola]WPB02761.1 hypothetical protein RHO25_007397 [Cercospora beticola]CAK1358560.1 unnamed protein product [Cercospora beticola]
MASETWNPDSKSFPTIHELPAIPDAPKYAAWFWGKDDFLGRLNLLTPTRVKAAAAEIRTGEMARTDLPLNVPQQPAFGRQQFKHEIKPLRKDYAYDDVYSLNTQSGTQWDGFRHVAHHDTGHFYNWTKGADIDGPEPNEKASIHYWSQHGIAGRGVLLDYRSWATEQGIKYDSATAHSITYDDLFAVGKHQGLDIRPASQGGDIQIGDILFIRSGFTEDYYSRTADQNTSIGLREFSFNGTDESKYQIWAGVSQEEKVRDWLHDCYFAAVGGDAPAFEQFPPPQDGSGLHAYILACWGMPLGEMIDLERVAELAKKNQRYTFFFTSAPANVVRGVSSHVNGTAIF